jgi:hypothetical protein
MRKVTVLFVLFVAALSACQKNSDNSNMPTTYKVNGITDQFIAFDTGATVAMGVTVNYAGPIQETVTLSLENLPAGIYVDSSNHYANTGIPTFSGYFLLTNSGTAKTGIYTVTLVCNGSVTGRKTYSFRLRVLSPTICSSGTLGAWNNSILFGLSTSTPFADTVKGDGSVINRIHFTNFFDSGFNVYADIYCKASTFTIPMQQVGMHYVYGSGVFTSTTISYGFTDSIDPLTIYSYGVNMSR